MKKIRVYLQYPWSFPDSPYYKYLLENLPKNIEYLNVQKQKGVITSWKKFAFMNKAKNFVRKIMFFLKRPNLVRTKTKENYDLIHCAHCLSLNKRPWVVDFEHYWSMSTSSDLANSIKGKEKIKEFLKSNYCKKILPWTEAAKKSLTDAINDKEIVDKIEVVYPAIPLPHLKIKKKDNKEITLLFIGRYFYEKGGLHVLEVFDKITQKNPNINSIFVSEVPKDILKKYQSNKKIKFYNLVPQKILFEEIYPKSDIFVYPGYSDTFGFALVEAMAFGLPIVTIDGFARKEIVENGKTGFVIETDNELKEKLSKIDSFNEFVERVDKRIQKEIVNELTNKINKLIKNKELREKMGKNARKEIESGKFSIKERNKQLKRIYEESLHI